MPLHKRNCSSWGHFIERRQWVVEGRGESSQGGTYGAKVGTVGRGGDGVNIRTGKLYSRREERKEESCRMCILKERATGVFSVVGKKKARCARG